MAAEVLDSAWSAAGKLVQAAVRQVPQAARNMRKARVMNVFSGIQDTPYALALKFAMPLGRPLSLRAHNFAADLQLND